MIRDKAVTELRIPTLDAPMRIMMSSCLFGMQVAYNGGSYGTHDQLRTIIDSPLTEVIHFCPENHAFGTPRDLCDIHGGNGHDVLKGKAKVLTDKGEDWTDALVAASHKMLAQAQANQVDVCIMMDISALCGTTVIYDGDRAKADKRYQKGPGLAAAVLIEHGFHIISQRDFASLEHLKSLLDPDHTPHPDATDHVGTPWYKDYFGE